MSEMKLSQTIYRLEAENKNKDNNLAHLMLRLVVPEQNRDNNICIYIYTNMPYVYHAPRRGCGFGLPSPEFGELEAETAKMS